jgi:adenine phosphoribosyltransferase
VSAELNLDAFIRKVPDFPKEGILFYDICGVLDSPEAFEYCIAEMERLYADSEIDAIAAIDARGFLFAAPFALRRKLPLVLVRKRGKLPGEVISRSFELEYGTDEVEIQSIELAEPRRFLIVDDLVATGGTLRAAADIIQDHGSSVVEIFCVVGLPFLEYGDRVGDIPVRTLIDYHGE